MMDEKLYQEELVEHYKYPKNKKNIENAHFSAGKHNPSCGDRIAMHGIIDNGIVIDIGFSGSGCVISQAAASMLTELCLGKTIEEILKMTKIDMLNLVGISLGPTRLKCAMLSLDVLQQGIMHYISVQSSAQ